jgi:hypothetical protein
LFTERGEYAMTYPRVGLSTILLAMLFVVPSFAHHSVAAMFDTTKTIPLKGTITRVDWRNPHASIYIDVKDATGKITNWWVELTGTGNLAKAGLDQSMIDMNQTYALEVYPAKNGGAQAVGITLTFPDSRSFDVVEKPAVAMPAR